MENAKKKGKILTGHYLAFALFLVLLQLTPQIAYQASFVGCSGLDCTLLDLVAVPINIFNYLLSAGALVLLLVIIWAGIRMAMYWFNEQPEQELNAAKLTLTRGLVGFVIIVSAILIINVLAVTILGLYRNAEIKSLLENLIYFD